jgi:hypothetical protein
MSVEKFIANTLRIAKEDLNAARLPQRDLSLRASRREDHTSDTDL